MFYNKEQTDALQSFADRFKSPDTTLQTIAQPGDIPKVSSTVVTTEPAKNLVTTQSSTLNNNILTEQQRIANLEKQRLAEQQAQDQRKSTNRETEDLKAADDRESGIKMDPYLEFAVRTERETQDRLDNQLREYNAALDRIAREAQDPAINSLLSSVQSTFARRADEMKQLNSELTRATHISTIRTGLSRFAQFRAGSIIEAEEDRGIKRLQELDRQKLEAEAAAIQAYQDGQFKAFNEKMKFLDNINKEKTKAAQDLLTANLEADKRASEAIKAARGEIKFAQAQEDRIISGLASNLATMLDMNDIASNNQLLGQVAAEYGIDPNLLMAAVRDSQIKQKKDELSIASSTASLQRTRQLISNSAKEDKSINDIINIFGDFMIAELSSGTDPDGLLQNIAANAESLGIKLNTSQYSQLKSIASQILSSNEDEEANTPELNFLMGGR